MHRLNINLSIAALGFVGFVASFWQTGQKFFILNNPDTPLSCNINPIADCGKVLNHSLSSLLGVPNSMIGMSVFAAITVMALVFFVHPPKNIRILQQIFLGLTTLMFLFPAWFFLVSLYIIGKICIFCVAIWVATIPMVVLAWREYGAAIGLQPMHSFVKNNSVNIIVFLYAVAIVLYLGRFREYYFE